MATNIDPRCNIAAAPAHVIASDGIRLSVRAHGPVDAPRLVVSHGNGMATDGYRAFWEPLTDAFQVIVVDMRGHGRSESGANAHHTWSQLADDLEAIWQALPRRYGTRTTVGVFHSLSAIASLAHMRRFGRRWDGLLLFDPPLAPPPGHPLAAMHRANMAELAAGARVRRREFAAPGDLAAKFARQPAFRNWATDAYAAMAYATLRKGASTWQLSCAPELEAVMYETNMDSSLLHIACDAEVPLAIVGGDPELAGAPASVLMGRAAGAEFGIPYEAVGGTTHFLQIEQPIACGARTRNFYNANAQRFAAKSRVAAT